MPCATLRGVRVTVTGHAPDEYTVYLPDAFDAQVGKEIAVSWGGASSSVGRGKVVAVEVAPDGLSYELTVDLPDGILGGLL